MKPTTDQNLLAFALGELPLLPRLCMRIQLAFSRKTRLRLVELQDASRVISSVNAPYGWIAFQANLAVRLRRLVMIDLLIGLLFIGGAIAGVYSVGSVVYDACAVPPHSSGSK